MIQTSVIPSAKRVFVNWAVAVTLGVLACSYVSPALALESASYRLYDTIPNYGTNGTPDASASYLLNENGITWYPLPLSSTNYLIVTAPPAIASSSSSSSAASSVSSIPSRPSGGRRGTRPPLPFHPSAGRRSSRSSSSRASSLPVALGSSSSASIAPLPEAPATGSIGTSCPETLRPSVPCIGDRCLCERPWSFGGMCVNAVRSLLPWFGIVCVVVELLLLLRIFRRHSAPVRRHR